MPNFRFCSQCQSDNQITVIENRNKSGLCTEHWKQIRRGESLHTLSPESIPPSTFLHPSPQTLFIPHPPQFYPKEDISSETERRLAALEAALLPQNKTTQSSERQDLWDAVETMQRVATRTDKYIDNVTHTLDSTLPIGIACFPDIHIGATGTVYKKILDDTRLILATPGMYCLFPGDGINNFIISSGRVATAGREDLISPRLQWEMYEDLLLRLQDRILAVLTGNHEAWTRAMACIDKVREIADKLHICYLKHGGTVNIFLGDGQHYQIAVGHRFLFHSNLNLTHRPKQYLRMRYPEADISVLGDKHEAAIETWPYAQKLRLSIACSTYKVYDDFAQSMGFPPSNPVLPTIILKGDKREMIPFWNLESACEYLVALRRTHETKIAQS